MYLLLHVVFSRELEPHTKNTVYLAARIKEIFLVYVSQDFDVAV